MDVSCHRPFLPGTSLESAVIPTAQASIFTVQYFPCYVWCSSIADFCSESVEWFPSTTSKFFLKFLVTTPVAQIITGIFYISRSTFVSSLYMNSCILTYFQLPFTRQFCLRVLPHLSVCMFSFFFCFLFITRACWEVLSTTYFPIS